MNNNHLSTTPKSSNQNNKRLSIALSVAAFVLVSFTAVYAGAAAKGEGALVGFVSSVQGNATIRRVHYKEAKLDGMNALRAGDVVRVQGKSSVLVNICGASQRVRIQGEAVFSVAKGGLKITKGKLGEKSAFDASLCRTLMASAAKYDKAKYIRSDVSEAAGAMSVLGLISSRSGSGASMKAIFDDVGSGGGGAYSDLGTTKQPPDGQTKAPNEGRSKQPEYAMKYEKSSDYGSAAPSMAPPPAPAPSAPPPPPVYHEEKIAKPNAEYINEPPRTLDVFSRAIFNWPPIPGAASYDVIVSDNVGAAVYSASSTRSFFIYPDAAPKLIEESLYICEIVAHDAAGLEIGGDAFTLSVRSDKRYKSFLAEESDLKKVVKKSGVNPDGYLLLGRFYESYNVLPLAAMAYQKALSLDLKNDILRDQLEELKKQL